MAVVVVYERCLSYKFHFNISLECDVSRLLGLMRCHSVSPVSTALTVAWIQARRFLFYSTICRTRRSAPLLNGARDCNLLPVGMLCISSKSILGATASRVLMAYCGFGSVPVRPRGSRVFLTLRADDGCLWYDGDTWLHWIERADRRYYLIWPICWLQSFVCCSQRRCISNLVLGLIASCSRLHKNAKLRRKKMQDFVLK